MTAKNATPVFLLAALLILVPGSRPAAQSVVGGYPIPSLDDEKNTYRRWGWAWTSSAEPNFSGDSTYRVSDPDIHGDTEGDDLWSYVMMYRRTGQQGYLHRAQAWANYFKQGYRACVGHQDRNFCYDRDGFQMDHMYGWGLIAWYEHSGDTAALTEAENLAALVESYWNQETALYPSGYSMSYYGLRKGARHLLLATRVAEATKKTRWITLRDKLINLWLQSSDWDQRGMYFYGDYDTDNNIVGRTGAYKAGARVQSAFHIGILAEAFAQAYRTTGREELKNRLIAMARFVDQYGMDPTYQYAGSFFGFVNGVMWHDYAAANPVTFWDPVYTTSLVNTLVYGYKLTGDQRLYDRAKHFFNRGTKGVYGSPTQRAANDTQVHHFVDTRFDTSSENFYLDYNKGELQYTYLMFEAPLSAGVPPAAPTIIRVQ